MKKRLKKTTLYWSLMVILIPVLTLMGPAPARGDTFTWVGGTGDWFANNNWSHTSIPTAGDDALISNGGTATISSGDAAALNLNLGNNPATSGTVTQTGGSLTVSTALRVGDASGSSGHYNLWGGSLSAPTVTVGASGFGGFLLDGRPDKNVTLRATQGLTLGESSGGEGIFTLAQATLETGYTNVGFSGTGTFAHVSGTHTVTNTLSLGHDSTSSGNYILEGGSLVSQGVGISNGEFLQTGGTNTIQGWLGVGAIAGGQAKYTLEGGTLSFGTGTFLQIGAGGTGTFTQTGGDVSFGSSDTTTNNLRIGLNGGTGSYSLQGEISTLTMDGMVNVGVTNNGTGGTGYFYQSGGTHSIIRTTLPEYGGDGGRLLLGNGINTYGYYELSGGQLNVDGKEILGINGGIGHFVQSGGTNDIKKTIVGGDGGRLLVGWNNSVGSYELSNGLLTVDGKEILGGRDNPTQTSGNGSFIQSGGTNIITGTYVNDGYGRLVVGWYDDSVGTYTLNSGLLKADRIILGDSDSGTPDQPDASGRGTLTINGGHLEVKDLVVGKAEDKGYGGFGKLELLSQDAYVEVSERLYFGPIGIFNAVLGATIHMTGSDYVNSSTTLENMTGLANLKLIFTGGPGVTDTFEVGFDLNTLEIGPNSRVQLVDLFDNIIKNGTLGDEGLHVASLILQEGAVLDKYGLNFTYDTLSGNPNQIVNTPIPGSLLLLGTGLAGLGALGWRRRKV